jgi:hypothetical protein
MKIGLYRSIVFLSAVLPMLGPPGLIGHIGSPWTIPPVAKKTGKKGWEKFQLVNLLLSNYICAFCGKSF